MSATERSADNSMVMEILRDDTGKELSQKRFDVAEITEKGQGFELSCYMPDSDAMKAKFVDMTFEVQAPSEYQHSAVVEVRADMKQKAEVAGFPCVDFTTGETSWDWSHMPICKQKLVKIEKFDPFKKFSKKGARMPLMVFIGDKGKNRRTHEGRARRDVKADERGWHAEKRTPWLFDGTKGKGAPTRGGGGKQRYPGWTLIAGPSDPNTWRSASSSNWNSW